MRTLPHFLPQFFPRGVQKLLARPAFARSTSHMQVRQALVTPSPLAIGFERKASSAWLHHRCRKNVGPASSMGLLRPGLGTPAVMPISCYFFGQQKERPLKSLVPRCTSDRHQTTSDIHHDSSFCLAVPKVSVSSAVNDPAWHSGRCH